MASRNRTCDRPSSTGESSRHAPETLCRPHTGRRHQLGTPKPPTTNKPTHVRLKGEVKRTNRFVQPALRLAPRSLLVPRMLGRRRAARAAAHRDGGMLRVADLSRLKVRGRRPLLLLLLRRGGARRAGAGAGRSGTAVAAADRLEREPGLLSLVALLWRRHYFALPACQTLCFCWCDLGRGCRSGARFWMTAEVASQ